MSLYNGVLYASAPPDGVTPDPDAPYEATSLLTVIGVFLPLAVITTGVRLYTRMAIQGQIAFDDYLMIAAMAMNIAMIACIINMLNYGLGKDLWNVPLQPDLFPNWMLPNVIAAILFCAATGLAKGSILLFYLRIFSSKSMKIAIWSTFGFTLSYSFASSFVNVFSCNPIVGSWRLEESLTAICINRPAFYFAQAGLGITADIATVVVPLPELKALQLRAKQKIGVAVLLTIGAFVCVISIVRLQSLYTLLNDANLTRNTTSALMWVVLELNLSISGGSISALKPFVQRFFPRLLGSSGASRGRNTSGAISLSSSQTPYGTGSHFSKSKKKSRITTNQDDAGSEEFIMPGTYGGTIVKTVQYGYQVDQSQKGDRASQLGVIRKNSKGSSIGQVGPPPHAL
ncbi:hypothetical protein BJ170DRAFT_679781 [Xylariales sp. AK1849]|nr:hypothetical protein BJ170DRAFT_679781 [Xylariales sp. AK1849]